MSRLSPGWAGATVALVIAALITPVRSAGQSGDNSLSRHFQAAVSRYENRDYAGALAELRSSEQAGESAPLRQLYFGLASARAGQWQGAEEALTVAVRQQPANGEAWYWLGAADLQLHRFTEAKTALERAVALRPSDGDAHRALALAKLESNDPQGAYEQWLAALQADPNDADSAYSIGRLFYDARRLTQAEQWLGRALRENPADYRASYYLGLCDEALGKVPDALTMYRASVEASVEAHRPYSWAFSGLGKLLLKSGELDKAEPVLEQGARLAPSARVLSALGELRLKQKRNTEAEQALLAAISDDPQFPEPHYLLGRLYATTGRKQQADAEFLRFKQLEAVADRQRQRLVVVEK